MPVSISGFKFFGLFTAIECRRVRKDTGKLKYFETKKGTIVVPFVVYMSKTRLYMKTTTKLSLGDLFTNPINRNLILILVSALVFATLVVTTSIIVYNQW